MGKVIEDREPLTEREVYEYLSKEVDKQAAHWGSDYIYTRWARESREKKMGEFKAGNVVQVYSENYTDHYGNGLGDFTDVLYSDGHVETICYGYLN